MGQIEELITRDGVLMEEEGYFLISEYIRIRKGKNVSIQMDPRKNMFREVELFHDAINVAIAWFNENKEQWQGK